MIADLIKLSRELYELDMMDESFHVDEMIEKLYGSGFSDSRQSFDNTNSSLEEESSLEDFVQSFKALTNNDEFINDLASIIYQYCDTNEIAKLNKLLGEYS